MEQRDIRRESAKNKASLSLGIEPVSVKGGYADEHGTKTEDENKHKENQKKTDWSAIGRNAAYASQYVSASWRIF